MIHPKFAIIDIETTGGLARRDKITEIGIIVFQNGEVVDQYTSLINPERSIPPEITRITGITNEMVEDAPKFYEIAKEVILKTQDCIFVAHNVHFDYGFIKEEFHQLGFSFSLKKLCTLQLSRKIFKGLPSYSLGSLIVHFSIEVEARHRAMDDCKATLALFKEILQAQGNAISDLPKLIPKFIKDQKLPAQLAEDTLAKLPERPGIYRMLDQDLLPVYIGKSKSIKDRIIQHFNESSPKVQKMLAKVHFIDHELTGNELMASLLEAQLIKFHQPEINRALRKKTHAFLLTKLKNPIGYNRFKITEAIWLDPNEEILNHYPTIQAAKQQVDYLIMQYNLCHLVDSGKTNHQACLAFQMQQCLGACIGKESIESYNERFAEACEHINSIFKEDFILIGAGITSHDRSVICVEHGFCRYTGFIDEDITIENPEQLKAYLKPYEGNVETNRMILNSIKKDKQFKLVKYTSLNTETGDREFY
ncbi:MAG: GIY-YIG nuclease family protein [Saprospiraceae bacterium]|nr:GIY-YIG nuclease family protein [Saprospiraceae bacterium]